MFIHPTDFIGEINIPNVDSPSVTENLTYFINRYEKRFLLLLLGHFVFEKLEEQIEVPEDDREAGFNELIKKLEDDKFYIACYVYKFYTYNEMGLSAGIGVVKPKGENSTPASPVSKVVKVWNFMSEWVHNPINKAWFFEWYRKYGWERYYFEAYYYETFKDEFAFTNSLNL